MLAFFVGIAALIICAVISSERKYLIPPKDKSATKDKKAPKQEQVAIAPASKEPAKEPEFKNPVGLNILLYVGCFLVISAIMGYVSTVDRDLVPPIVLTVTILALIASLLVFKFVKFLKPSSYAFNITSLIMFFFWIPSLEALGLSWGYAILASFFFMTGSSIISAAIFKHKALWYAPAASLIGLIISALGTLSDELAIGTEPAVYCMIICFMLLGIMLRLFWKAKVRWLPVQTRYATRTFSFVYPVISGFLTLIACSELEDFPLILTVFTTLLTVYLVLEHIINKSKSLISVLRVCLEAVCIALAIDISYGLIDTGSDILHRNIILLTILASSVIQGLISMLVFAVKHDEESHSRERIVFAFSLVGLAICSMFGGGYPDGSLSSFKSDTFSTIILLFAQLSVILFTILTILLDRNALLLIITALGICDIALTNLESSQLLACIILSASSVVFSISHWLLRRIDQKHALSASISAASICTFFALVLGSESSITYIPMLGIGLSLAIQGFMLKKSALRISGIYVVASGIIAAWSSIRGGLAVETRTGFLFPTTTYPSWAYAVDAIICLVPPAAAFFLSIFDKKQLKTLKDGTQRYSISPNFVIGAVLTIFNAIIVYPALSHTLVFLNFTLALASLIGVIIWSAARKWLGFEIAALASILILVLENISYNIWITLIVAGLGIIGIVIFVAYRNYRNFNSNSEK